MARYKLSDKDVASALAELPDWEIKDGKLHRTYKFDSFATAMGWMVSVAIFADKIDHHPEWCNVYGRVTVDLSTHDMDNAISNLDILLAKKMDSLAA
ncbi:MAG: 4a-hydroxytetrahydrobiopterin dehydratase [Ardenticatenaceae bacterium]|nr:4a-hydroxytetrahydrobiopterin dehydratase [Ardenticatenaceae bacterium]